MNCPAFMPTAALAMLLAGCGAPPPTSAPLAEVVEWPTDPCGTPTEAFVRASNLRAEVPRPLGVPPCTERIRYVRAGAHGRDVLVVVWRDTRPMAVDGAPLSAAVVLVDGAQSVLEGLPPPDTEADGRALLRGAVLAMHRSPNVVFVSQSESTWYDEWGPLFRLFEGVPIGMSGRAALTALGIERETGMSGWLARVTRYDASLEGGVAVVHTSVIHESHGGAMERPPWVFDPDTPSPGIDGL